MQYTCANATLTEWFNSLMQKITLKIQVCGRDFHINADLKS